MPTTEVHSSVKKGDDGDGANVPRNPLERRLNPYGWTNEPEGVTYERAHPRLLIFMSRMGVAGEAAWSAISEAALSQLEGFRAEEAFCMAILRVRSSRASAR